MSEPIRVIVADDEPLFRVGIVETLRAESDITVAGQVVNLEGIERVEKQGIDILLISSNLLPLPKADYLNDFSTQFPQIKLLLLIADLDEIWIRGLVDSGVKGFFLRTEPPEALISAIRLVYIDRYYFGHPDILEQLRLSDDPLDELTQRERDIFNLLIQGKSNQEIANALSLANQSVRNRLSGIYKKLGLSGRGEAILWASKWGISLMNEISLGNVPSG